jgi:predicted transporter
MIGLLWQLGILSAVLIFGVKIGLAMGFSGLSKKVGVLIALGYGAGIFLLSTMVTGSSNPFYKTIVDYNFVMFSVMSLIIIYAGLHTIREWKVNQKNHAKATCAAMIAPCPCCFTAVIAAIILAAPVIGASSALIGQYAAVFLTVTILAVYFSSDLIVKLVNRPYPILLGNFMLFAGLYFLATVIVLPNINQVLQSPMKPYDVSSISTITYVVVLAVVLLLIGFYKTRRESIWR